MVGKMPGPTTFCCVLFGEGVYEMIEQQELEVGEECGGMARTGAVSYPLPELLAYLNAKQEEDQEYMVLAQLLQACCAVIENANATWQSGRYRSEDALEVTCEAVHAGFKRLIPLILANVAGGWPELLAYLEQPETCPWYDALLDWSVLPAIDSDESVP